MSTTATLLCTVDRKKRLHEFRSAGHWFGRHIAEQAVASLADNFTRKNAEAFLAANMAEREAAMRQIGATDEDVQAWQRACRQNFWSKLKGCLPDEE